MKSSIINCHTAHSVCHKKGNVALRLEELSPSRKALVRLMKQVYNGFIYKLPVIAGEPVLDPMPAYTFIIRFPIKSRKVTAPDFALKQQVLDLFETFNSHQDLLVLRLEIKEGLPFKVEAQGQDRRKTGW